MEDLQKLQEVIKHLNKKCESYKNILKFSDAPQILIDYPEFFTSNPPTGEDIEWAKEQIKEAEGW